MACESYDGKGACNHVHGHRRQQLTADILDENDARRHDVRVIDRDPPVIGKVLTLDVNRPAIKLGAPDPGRFMIGGGVVVIITAIGYSDPLGKERRSSAPREPGGLSARNSD